MSWVTDIVEWDILDPNAIPVQSSGKAREAWLLLRCGRFVLKSMRIPYRDGIISYEQLYNRNKSHFPAHLSGAYISGLLGFPGRGPGAPAGDFSHCMHPQQDRNAEGLPGSA